MASRTEVRAEIIGLSEAGFNPSKIASTLKIARKTVYRTMKKKNNGTKNPLLYDSTSRTKRKLTPRVAALLKKRIKAPTKSLRRVAAEAGQNQELVRRLVRLSGWRSLRRTKVPLISEEGRKKREI